jgi:DNA-binding transcriptional LysR family regulator
MVMLRCKTRRRVQLATNVCVLISKNRRSDWIDRVTAAGRPDFPLDQSEIIEFPNSMLAYQAGADGLGVVIGQVPLLGPEFAAQALITLFDKAIRQGSYYAVWRGENGADPKGAAVPVLAAEAA